MIVKSGRKWLVKSKSGKVLGRHESRFAAQVQLRAIEAAKHQKGEK